jgi:hypothetical protein
MGPPVQRWQVTSANTITRLADVSPSGANLTMTVPPQSITLFVVPSALRRAARH